MKKLTGLIVLLIPIGLCIVAMIDYAGVENTFLAFYIFSLGFLYITMAIELLT